jgi:hypothetical protein
VNGYFIEIVKQLGAFFETEGLRLNLKVNCYSILFLLFIIGSQ